MAAHDGGYALVTPARDERENLERLARSVVAQTLTPRTWIVVDDGSTDGTAELARELAARHAWVRVLSTGGPAGDLANGRRDGRALEAFRHGVRTLADPVAVVAKVDADTSFDPGYFEQIVARFEARPELGIAGGACYELRNGRWERQRTSATHPRGASRAYRWECLDAVMSLEARMGWDGLDEVKARALGYRSEAFADLGFRHHRATGGRERHPLSHYAAQGRASWYMGYRLSYLLLRTAYRALREPAAAGMAWGYAAAAVARAPRCPDAGLVERVRGEQRLSRALGRGAPR